MLLQSLLRPVLTPLMSGVMNARPPLSSIAPSTDLTADDGSTILYEDDGTTVLTED